MKDNKINSKDGRGKGPRVELATVPEAKFLKKTSEYLSEATKKKLARIPVHGVIYFYGKAMISCYQMESNLKSFVSMWERITTGSTAEANVLYEKLKHKTLGAVIEVGKKNGAINADLANSLGHARDLRNQLTHHVGDWTYLRLLTRKGADEVVDDLCEMDRIFSEISAEMSGLAYLCLALSGQSVHKFQQYGADLIEQLVNSKDMKSARKAHIKRTTRATKSSDPPSSHPSTHKTPS
jgi:hypothetical protein